MHELSIAHSLVEVALEALNDHAPGARVGTVHLRLGALAGVDVQALLFSYDLVTDGTALAGSALKVERVPVRVYCPVCNDETEVESPSNLSCPVCHTRSGDIRAGRELEVFALDLVENDTPAGTKAAYTETGEIAPEDHHS